MDDKERQAGLLLQSGVAHHTNGRLEAARGAYRAVLDTEPHHRNALSLLAALAHCRGDNVERDALIIRAAASPPCQHNALLGVASALRNTPKIADAEACYRISLEIEPTDADAHHNLGTLLFKHLHRHAEAVDAYRSALKVDPSRFLTHAALACVLTFSDRLPEAEDAYAEYIRTAPDEAANQAKLDHAGFLLLTGRLDQGWLAYETRWAVPRPASIEPRGISRPMWDGSPLAGRTILITAEQGGGDMIQFCRYAPLLATQGKVIVETWPPLKRLLTTLSGVETVISTTGEVRPDHDLQCPMMSIPRHLETTLDTIPNTTPYLAADAEKVAEWKERLLILPGLRVGLTWSGGIGGGPEGHLRHLDLHDLAPLGSIPGVSLISLQRGQRAHEADRPPPGMKMHSYTRELSDFADNAALMEALDLIVSVDTSIAHLAGALGKPVWLLNRYESDWRWLLNRDDSPWYPTLRQFRQPNPGDWSTVVENVRTALIEFASARA